MITAIQDNKYKFELPQTRRIKQPMAMIIFYPYSYQLETINQLIVTGYHLSRADVLRHAIRYTLQALQTNTIKFTDLLFQYESSLNDQPQLVSLHDKISYKETKYFKEYLDQFINLAQMNPPKINLSSFIRLSIDYYMQSVEYYCLPVLVSHQGMCQATQFHSQNKTTSKRTICNTPANYTCPICKKYLCFSCFRKKYHERSCKMLRTKQNKYNRKNNLPLLK